MIDDDWYSFGLAALEKEVERIIRSFFSEFRESLALKRSQPYPLVDIYEDQEYIRIYVELGGLSSNDIEVYVTSDLVIVEGEKKERDNLDEPRNYICMEREFGPFRRVIEIPGVVDTGRVNASMQGGVLELIFPKIVDRRMRRRKVVIRDFEG